MSSIISQDAGDPTFNEINTLSFIQFSGFEKTQTTLDDLLSFFGKFPNVLNVTKRLYEDRKDPERKKHFKGSVFVVFKDKESAQKFMDLESLKSPDEKEELIRKWQKGKFFSLHNSIP